MKKMKSVFSLVFTITNLLLSSSEFVYSQEGTLVSESEFGVVYSTQNEDEVIVVDDQGSKYVLAGEDAVYILDENRNVIESIPYASGEPDYCENGEATTSSTTIDYRGCYVGQNFIPYQAELALVTGIVASITSGGTSVAAGIAAAILGYNATGQNLYWRKCGTQYIPEYDTAFCQITTTFYADASRTQYISSTTQNNYGFPCSNLPFPY